MKNHTNYKGIMPVNERLCCLHVNRKRYDVDVNVNVTPNETVCTCSWCGGKINPNNVKPTQVLQYRNYEGTFKVGDTVMFNGKKYRFDAWQELELAE